MIVGVVAGAVAAALPVSATAAAPSGASPVTAAPAAGGADARTVTLVTGQQITVVTGRTGPPSYRIRPSGPGDDGVVSWQFGGGDHYVVPVDALPYLGKGLDRSLFDVTALARDGGAGGDRIPVTLAFGAKTEPATPPGITLTSAGIAENARAQGYFAADSSAAFAKALRQRIGADVAAGRRPGSTPLFAGVTSISAAGTDAPAAGAGAPNLVTPHYPLRYLQIDATDALGAPADADAFVMNNDSLAREAADVPVVGGLGRVAVPAGDYTVAGLFPRWDDEGYLTDLREVPSLDVTVPAAGPTTVVAVDARTATAAISVHTPRPSTQEVRALDLERVDATGQAAANFGVETWSADSPMSVTPQPAPTVGRLELRMRFDTVSPAADPDPAGGPDPSPSPSPDPSPGQGSSASPGQGSSASPGQGSSPVPRADDPYRYDLAFRSDHIDADQAYTAEPGQLATVHHTFSHDPAADPEGSTLLAGPFDTDPLVNLDEVSGYTALALPGRLTEYVHTYPGSRWAEEVATSSAFVDAEPRSFAGGRTYGVDWLHGPLAPTLGDHHDGWNTGCLMCTAGSTATLAYQSLGDSTPDHLGERWGLNSRVTAYVDGGKVFAADDYTGALLTDVPVGAATYRLVLTTDSAGDPGLSQSTHTVTDLTVRSPAVPDPGSALPASRSCEGGSAGTPCAILPALNLTYRLATDLNNISHLPLQAMELSVGHVRYDGKGSTAAITSVAVRTSFDGGATWRSAKVAGAHGAYAALWANPASSGGSSPMLRVTVKDAAGGSLTQTITDAYTVAPAASPQG